MQGKADGHIPIIGYHSQEEVIQSCEEWEKVQLAESSCIGNDAALGLDVQQHLGDGGGGEPMSTKERFDRKMYMGVCKWELS